MMKNYFKIALRHLTKNKVYAFINSAGLATGMAIALLIGIWIWDELSFDHYHENHARLGLILKRRFGSGEPVTEWGTDIPLADELRTRYAGPFKHLALTSFDNDILSTGDKKMDQAGVWTQPDLPGMLTLHMLAGSKDALKDPSSILLTATLARSLFGKADPMNKTVRIDNEWDAKVAGVYEDLPDNTLFSRFAFFLSWDKYADTHIWEKKRRTKWGNHVGVLFVEPTDQPAFARTDAAIQNTPAEHLKQGKEQLLLQPMDKLHLYNEFRNGHAVGGRLQFVWLFGIIGVFVLLLACINFMNLSTARSEQRAKEVGVRKSLGSLRTQLIGQFLSESVIVAFIALVLALLLAQALLPFFNQLAGKKLSILWSQPLFWLLLTGFTLFTGLISGSYPAFYLSAFDPIRVLKGTFRAGRLASLPRKVLVVVQFTVSITLAIGSLIVYRQIQFAQNRPVGYSREGLVSVLILHSPGARAQHYDALRSDLIQTGAVENMTQSSSSQTGIEHGEAGFNWKGKDPGFNPYFATIAVTHDYGKTIGWTLLAHHNFSPAFPTAPSPLLPTNTSSKQMGFKDPIGQTIQYHGGNHIITGVVKDMVMDSPYSPADPTVFFIDYNWKNYVTLRVRREPAIPEGHEPTR